MNLMQRALIKKDIRGITTNKRMFSVLLIVPLVLTIVMPSIFIVAIKMAADQAGDFDQMLKLLPESMLTGDLGELVLELFLNNVMPIFFMMIPIMAASVMAASSFVGEKEKRTLETLLYCPLTVAQIFQAKILASFIMSMAVSFLSFFAMLIVVEAELRLFSGTVFIPAVTWLIVMLLVAPAVSLIAITMIVRGSAKSQTMEESQQRSAFLILPIVLLVAGQFAGFILISGWVLLGLGIVLMAVAILLIRGALGRFNYETLLK